MGGSGSGEAGVRGAVSLGSASLPARQVVAAGGGWHTRWDMGWHPTWASQPTGGVSAYGCPLPRWLVHALWLPSCEPRLGQARLG